MERPFSSGGSCLEIALSEIFESSNKLHVATFEEVRVLSDRGFVAVDVAASKDHCGGGDAD